MGLLVSFVGVAFRRFIHTLLIGARFTLVIMVLVIILVVVAIIFFARGLSDSAHQWILLRRVLLGECVVLVFDKYNFRHVRGFLDLKSVDSKNITQYQEPLLQIDRVVGLEINNLNIA